MHDVIYSLHFLIEILAFFLQTVLKIYYILKVGNNARVEFLFTRFFYKQHFHKQRQAEISNTLRLRFYLIHFILSSKNNRIGHTLKNNQKNMYACNHEIM